MGSIPAGAGKPSGWATEMAVAWGLSPQVRGSRRLLNELGRQAGSIPAGAGKPSNHQRRCRWTWVYPRRCGEAGADGLHWTRFKGLSPQVRGSPAQPGQSDPGRGSIPAGAGKPSTSLPRHGRLRVYPRRCGEALDQDDLEHNDWGLSPQVRGSRILLSCRAPCLGSIPAGAGKPGDNSERRSRARVYPRRCGEARAVGAQRLPDRGLSPQVRGSHRHA